MRNFPKLLPPKIKILPTLPKMLFICLPFFMGSIIKKRLSTKWYLQNIIINGSFMQVHLKSFLIPNFRLFFFLICHHILNPVTTASCKVLAFIFKLKLVLWYSYKRTTRQSQNYLGGSVVTNQGEMPGPERCYVTQTVHIFAVKDSCQGVKGYTFPGS